MKNLKFNKDFYIIERFLKYSKFESPNRIREIKKHFPAWTWEVSFSEFQTAYYYNTNRPKSPKDGILIRVLRDNYKDPYCTVEV